MKVTGHAGLSRSGGVLDINSLGIAVWPMRPSS